MGPVVLPPGILAVPCLVAVSGPAGVSESQMSCSAGRQGQAQQLEAGSCQTLQLIGWAGLSER